MDRDVGDAARVREGVTVRVGAAVFVAANVFVGAAVFVGAIFCVGATVLVGTDDGISLGNAVSPGMVVCVGASVWVNVGAVKGGVGFCAGGATTAGTAQPAVIIKLIKTITCFIIAIVTLSNIQDSFRVKHVVLP